MSTKQKWLSQWVSVTDSLTQSESVSDKVTYWAVRWQLKILLLLSIYLISLFLSILCWLGVHSHTGGEALKYFLITIRSFWRCPPFLFALFHFLSQYFQFADLWDPSLARCWNFYIKSVACTATGEEDDDDDEDMRMTRSNVLKVKWFKIAQWHSS